MSQSRKKNIQLRSSFQELLSSWKDYFSLNSRVKRGLMVVFGLILAEIVVLLWLDFIPPISANADAEKFRKEIDAFYAEKPAHTPQQNEEGSASNANTEISVTEKKYVATAKAKPELFSFNPNNLPEADWKRMGFSEKQIHSIKNYEGKGGKFRTKEDVAKMYAISKEEFRLIEPYIVIPEKPDEKKLVPEKYKKEILMVDIGTADSVELEKLPMVGSYLAKKIFTYREKLGGFYSISQVKEVRGMRDSSMMAILPHIMLKDSLNLRKINLNTADYNELNEHPYIDNVIANIIVSYRTQHGPFKSTEDLRKVALVDEELYRKIAPYLKVE
jgi:competence protein ComEA